MIAALRGSLDANDNPPHSLNTILVGKRVISIHCPSGPDHIACSTQGECRTPHEHGLVSGKQAPDKPFHAKQPAFS